MKRFISLLLALVVLSLGIAPVQHVEAQTQSPVTINAYINDGYVAGPNVETTRPFDVAVAVYHTLDSARATIVFEPFDTSWHPSAWQGTGLVGTWDSTDGTVFIWDGTLNNGAASDLGIHVSDNVWPGQTKTFKITVNVDGQPSQEATLTVTNPSTPTPPPTPVVTAHTWAAAFGVPAGQTIETCDAFTLGIAVYQNQNTLLPASVTFSGILPGSEPVFKKSETLGGSVLNTPDGFVWTGDLLVQGSASEMWVDVGKNLGYESTTEYLITVTPAGGQSVVYSLHVINTCLQPDKYKIFMPIIGKD